MRREKSHINCSPVTSPSRVPLGTPALIQPPRALLTLLEKSAINKILPHNKEPLQAANFLYYLCCNEKGTSCSKSCQPASPAEPFAMEPRPAAPQPAHQHFPGKWRTNPTSNNRYLILPGPLYLTLLLNLILRPVTRRPAGRNNLLSLPYPKRSREMELVAPHHAFEAIYFFLLHKGH